MSRYIMLEDAIRVFKKTEPPMYLLDHREALINNPDHKVWKKFFDELLSLSSIEVVHKDNTKLY